MPNPVPLTLGSFPCQLQYSKLTLLASQNLHEKTLGHDDVAGTPESRPTFMSVKCNTSFALLTLDRRITSSFNRTAPAPCLILAAVMDRRIFRVVPGKLEL
jgi:hypothetical protein